MSSGVRWKPFAALIPILILAAVGLGLIFHYQRHEVWIRLACEVLLAPTHIVPEPISTNMREIAKRLSR